VNNAVYKNPTIGCPTYFSNNLIKPIAGPVMMGTPSVVTEIIFFSIDVKFF